MVLAHGNQVLVVVEHLRILLLITPVEMIDAIGRFKAVVHALFGAQQFLTAQHEGNALRGEYSRLSQQVKTNQLIFGNTWQTRLQSVKETHVVMTAHIADHLSRLCCPWLF